MSHVVSFSNSRTSQRDSTLSTSTARRARGRIAFVATRIAWRGNILDDYIWMKLGEDSLSRPGPAIDSFLRLVSDHSGVLFRGEQVALRKID
jgi:hypothetical protein